MQIKLVFAESPVHGATNHKLWSKGCWILWVV